jgi:hypothetical protein
MFIGGLWDDKGMVVFRVSPTVVKTFQNLRHQSAARYAIHNRHLLSPLPEFTGRDLDRVTCDILLSAYLGVNPREDLEQLACMQRRGRVLWIKFGGGQINNSRWVIQNLGRAYEHYDQSGRVLTAKVSLTLLEYPGRRVL